MSDTPPVLVESGLSASRVFERHYEVDEIAKMWHLSRDTIRRIFFSEPGVLKVVRPGTRYKRSHVTLRIPESVLRRVHRGMSEAGA
jgi:hypothetical protein